MIGVVPEHNFPMDLAMDCDGGSEVEEITRVERFALWGVRLAALPFLLFGTVLWVLIVGTAASGRGLAALAAGLSDCLRVCVGLNPQIE